MTDHDCAPEVTAQVHAHIVAMGVPEFAASKETLAEEIDGPHPTQVGRALRALVASGHLAIVRKGTGGPHPSRYRLLNKAAPGGGA